MATLPHTAYMSCPCHVELTVSEREQTVAKAEEEERTERRLTKVQAARQRRRLVKA